VGLVTFYPIQDAMVCFGRLAAGGIRHSGLSWLGVRGVAEMRDARQVRIWGAAVMLGQAFVQRGQRCHRRRS
jgi:hypothetical protein